MFDRVQMKIQARKERYQKQKESYDEPVVNLLRGKVFCANCGRAMELSKSVSAVATNRYYRCKLYNETAGGRCSLKSVRKEALEKLVLETIQYHIKTYCNVESMIQQLNTTEAAKKKLTECKKKMEALTGEWQKNVTLANGLNEDYQEKLLDESEYLFLKVEYDCKIKAVNEQIEELKKYMDTYKIDFTINPEFSKRISRFKLTSHLTRGMVEAFITRIEIGEANHISIRLDCKDEITYLLKIAKERKAELYDSEK